MTAATDRAVALTDDPGAPSIAALLESTGASAIARDTPSPEVASRLDAVRQRLGSFSPAHRALVARTLTQILESIAWPYAHHYVEKALQNPGTGDREPDTAHVVCLADVKPEEIKWLWPGWIPLGKLTVLEGDPGLGKSTLALALAAAVSTGRALPGAGPAAPAGVVIVTYEDGLADTIRPRLDAAGADVSRVHALQGIAPPDGLERLVCLPDDCPTVFEVVARLGAKLLIIDPLTAALSGETDSHRDSDIRRALAPLARYAEESGVAVVVIRHLRKSAGRAISSGGGSVAIGAAARAVLAVHEDPDHPEDTGARILAVVKANLAERPPSLLWRLASEPGKAAAVAWGGTSAHTADKLAALRGDSEGGQDSEREIDEWLRGTLEAGPQDRKEVLRLATSDGFPARTLDRAAGRLGVLRRQSGYGSEKHSIWALPSIPPQSRQSSPTNSVGTIGAISGETAPELCPRCGGSDLTWTPTGNVCERCPVASAAEPEAALTLM